MKQITKRVSERCAEVNVTPGGLGIPPAEILPRFQWHEKQFLKGDKSIIGAIPNLWASLPDNILLTRHYYGNHPWFQPQPDAVYILKDGVPAMVGADYVRKYLINKGTLENEMKKNINKFNGNKINFGGGIGYGAVGKGPNAIFKKDHFGFIKKYNYEGRLGKRYFGGNNAQNQNNENGMDNNGFSSLKGVWRDNYKSDSWYLKKEIYKKLKELDDEIGILYFYFVKI